MTSKVEVHILPISKFDDFCFPLFGPSDQIKRAKKCTTNMLSEDSPKYGECSSGHPRENQTHEKNYKLLENS